MWELTTRLLVMTSLTLTIAIAGCSPAPPARPATTQPLASPRDLPGLTNFAEVSPVLYRGAQPMPEGFDRLKQMGVKTIVDLRGKSHRDEVEAGGLKYLHIPSSAAHIEEDKVVQFLRIVREPANQPVFVHCDRGADRTGCYVAAYRIVEQGWIAQDAEAELPRFRFDPFWQDILSYLNHLDPDRLRRVLNQPPATRPVATQTSADRSRSED